jgi:hypothetical protein
MPKTLSGIETGSGEAVGSRTSGSKTPKTLSGIETSELRISPSQNEWFQNT